MPALRPHQRQIGRPTEEPVRRSNRCQQGLKIGELEITLRQLRRRCGGLTPSQEARVRALALPQLEALAEALLDFQGADDLEAWLASR
ncbi:MAG: DUF4351 domain-containing protein [Cyanobium sp.]